jgi:hypothetical protein
MKSKIIQFNARVNTFILNFYKKGVSMNHD